ncbi:MAG: NAD dependent epimerase/dehydratase [Candidatus Beckwithbacteria bacterium GW2011_GWB1_47_15]|uniref:NAD dependent epimerase/dehydratase n=1 Tax=Candidatus Beckwithbacteria bacterium GW2011_GWB1_47_15 TaxID=1618371 RepID=A0A0G1UT50_9BACT|nr:MAG: NAD dependent epimerase/dehydratase, UDP-glucose 4-epimerase [Candidatus Beckwithbacteria bacterium GW2011_GWC1_49_16]KKU35711.1 MAG: NAD dependent epimerase/dehydratase [Candidatus Beckwithbacteria bacterium GW2011_GWA1_46_30]KKU60910.1 MAG: NAD dependent epimerase/dehydratase [Candidatus Beckwithbacteria bacterium GW2011_GWB1_47_15]KKU72270.1 MAG: NAD dependent epimerase/dehydratase [Candidatus Beckwithbacteria bacterium GW2011_GWA2_47_25]KKW04970.1 MAG: NAD dependent epimerase/dehydr
MKSALITGSSGFIGQHLIAALKKLGVTTFEFSRSRGKDLTDRADFADLPPVEAVFHLGAVSGYKDSNQDPLKAYRVNVLGTVNVLEYCRGAGAKMIFPSTYVYAPPYETHKKETDPARPTTHYSMTKYLGERLCRFYSRVFGANTLILRTSNVYGQGQTAKYIVPIVVKHVLDKKPLGLTKPGVERGFIFIDDLVEAYIKLSEAETRPGEVFNVGPNQPTRLDDLVKTIIKLAGNKTKVVYSGKERSHEVGQNRIDITKLKNKLKWQPKVGLEEGLKRYLTSLGR